MAESGVSVVTVTFNNATGLRETLVSLAALRQPPREVVIVDGGSTDGSDAVAREFAARLSLSYVSEPDEGIYDAMNKGLRRVRGSLVHYLNAGDCVVGEPYDGVASPVRLGVEIHDERGRLLMHDFVKLGGFGYCHQGVIFPAAHLPYRTEFRIAGDLDLIARTFPAGLAALPMATGGGVRFGLGGVSTKRVASRDREIRQILWENLPAGKAIRLIAILRAKALVPRAVRRWLFSRGSRA